jgi:hypothetical protein
MAGLKKTEFGFMPHFFSGKHEKTDNLWESSSGVNFSIDSMPAGAEKIIRPKQDGIYLYKRNRLVKLSKEQSEEKFHTYKKNGFYFLPNSGRFFKRIPLTSLRWLERCRIQFLVSVYGLEFFPFATPVLTSPRVRLECSEYCDDK